MSPERFDGIFFDLDGTLTDPFEGITGCIQHAMRGVGVPPPVQAELAWGIGPSLHESLCVLVGPSRADEALGLYRERFSWIGWRENRPYAGIADVLRGLQQQGGRLFVASSKPHVFVDRILQHFELAHFFQRTYGSELDGRFADKGELLDHALGELDFSGSNCLMIGDRSHDAVAAARHKMAFIGALYGFGSRDEYESAGYGAWAEEPGQIPGLIARA